VLVSAGRDARPWRGQIEGPPSHAAPSYDATCYLCPGNERASGDRNPDYETTFVFTNDFASLRPDPVDATPRNDPLFTEVPERGTCRVLCFSRRHDVTLAQMAHADVRRVVDLWCDQHDELARDWAWVQIFENRGAAMGASNPHPHGQIWAGAAVPTLVAAEGDRQRGHLADHGAALLAEYARREVALDERVVVRTDDWLVVVPYWATWPFETLLLSRRGAARFGDLTDAERDSLATGLKELLSGYDALFGVPFPYSMGWHPAPGDRPAPHWVLHAHVYPPLLRADARKFLVGYELLAEPQRDLTPEDAADRLRAAVAAGMQA
jgi:UDPglucose--hexose-1-phosphate uridylyltransferase